MQFGQLGSLQAGGAILREGRMDCPHQVGFFDRFGQEVDRAGLDRAYRRGNIAVSRDEDNRRERVLSRLAEQIEAVDVRKLHIQNETRRYVWVRMCEVL